MARLIRPARARSLPSTNGALVPSGAAIMAPSPGASNRFFGHYGFRQGWGGFGGRGTWGHDPAHRLGVPYPNQQLAGRTEAALWRKPPRASAVRRLRASRVASRRPRAINRGRRFRAHPDIALRNSTAAAVASAGAVVHAVSAGAAAVHAALAAVVAAGDSRAAARYPHIV